MQELQSRFLIDCIRQAKHEGDIPRAPLLSEMHPRHCAQLCGVRGAWGLGKCEGRDKNGTRLLEEDLGYRRLGLICLDPVCWTLATGLSCCHAASVGWVFKTSRAAKLQMLGSGEITLMGGLCIARLWADAKPRVLASMSECAEKIRSVEKRKWTLNLFCLVQWAW